MERWIEDSGNAALMGRELPPDEVLAADERITGWARELRQAGFEGRHGRAPCPRLLDLLLGQDSRPPARRGWPPGTPGRRAAGGPVPGGWPAGSPSPSRWPPWPASRDRPGDLSGLGPVDPWLTRDLATAAAPTPRPPGA